MNPEPPYCQLDTPLLEISRRFADEAMHGMLVVDDEMRLLGVITQSDLIDQQANLHLPTAIAIFDMVIPFGEKRFQKEMDCFQAIVASDIMVEDVRTVDADAKMMDVASIMSDEHIHHLPVLENGSVIGWVTKGDMIGALAKHIQRDQ